MTGVRCLGHRHPAHAAVVLLLLSLAGCRVHSPATRLVLASTTSTQDSGLFDELLPAFEKVHPEQDIVVVAVGSGEALELGRRGDADVLLVHSPAAESTYVAEGRAQERRPVMYNDFVVVGPAADPAGIRGMTDAAAALQRIAGAGATFVSRGDESGTHAKERSLWTAAALSPAGAWYINAGQGMGEVLNIASEKAAYTLSDRATFLNLRDRLALQLLVEGDVRLRNQYSVIVVQGAKNAKGAVAFADWLTSPAGQDFIGHYGVARFGSALFTPDATAH